MNHLLTRRNLLKTVALGAAAFGLVAAAPQLADARPRPGGDPANSPKGSWAGTYVSVIDQSTGPIALNVTKDKVLRGGLEVHQAKGQLTIGNKVVKKKALGSYTTISRVVALTVPARKGLAGTIAAELSEDGQTLEGIYFVINTSNGQTVDQGDCVLTRQ